MDFVVGLKLVMPCLLIIGTQVYNRACCWLSIILPIHFLLEACISKALFAPKFHFDFFHNEGRTHTGSGFFILSAHWLIWQPPPRNLPKI